jgi:predicted acyl esterase
MAISSCSRIYAADSNSEGVFKLSSAVDLNDPKATNETTDAYDTIDWLVKNVKNNDGKVGMLGISYAGLTTAMALLHPHPALKAMSEQASTARTPKPIIPMAKKVNAGCWFRIIAIQPI